MKHRKSTEQAFPWVRTFHRIKERCYDPNHKYYHRYGGRGIQLAMDKSELKILWLRDKADDMKKPSIDRIDNDGHYTFNNCRYIEKSKNIGRKHKEKTHCHKGHPLSGKNLYVNKSNGFRFCRTCKRSQLHRHLFRRDMLDLLNTITNPTNKKEKQK